MTELMNDNTVLTGREVVQRIKDKEILRKQIKKELKRNELVIYVLAK